MSRSQRAAVTLVLSHLRDDDADNDLYSEKGWAEIINAAGRDALARELSTRLLKRSGLDGLVRAVASAATRTLQAFPDAASDALTQRGGNLYNVHAPFIEHALAYLNADPVDSDSFPPDHAVYYVGSACLALASVNVDAADHFVCGLVGMLEAAPPAATGR